jgi:hypothetical protein
VQTNPRKTKENCFLFVGFLWPNWAFSMSYERKNKKIVPALTRVAGCSKKRLKRKIRFPVVGPRDGLGWVR